MVYGTPPNNEMNFWITGPLSSHGGPLATFEKAFEKELLSLKACGNKISLNNVTYIKMGLNLRGLSLGDRYWFLLLLRETCLSSPWSSDKTSLREGKWIGGCCFSISPFGQPFFALLGLHLPSQGGALECEANKNVPGGSSRWPALEQMGRPCSRSARLPVKGVQQLARSRPFNKY